jgi:hypothetical protein
VVLLEFSKKKNFWPELKNENNDSETLKIFYNHITFFTATTYKTKENSSWDISAQNFSKQNHRTFVQGRMVFKEKWLYQLVEQPHFSHLSGQRFAYFVVQKKAVNELSMRPRYVLLDLCLERNCYCFTIWEEGVTSWGSLINLKTSLLTSKAFDFRLFLKFKIKGLYVDDFQLQIIQNFQFTRL